MSLTLRPLTDEDEASFRRGLKEWSESELRWYAPDWKQGMSFPNLLIRLQKNRNGSELPTNFVPSTMLYGFVDRIIVGHLKVRHRLNEASKIYGGHIGYSVMSKYRSRGYASAMLRQALPICLSVGIRDALITVDDDNAHSIRVIEKAGGRLQDTFYNATVKKPIRRYWVKCEGSSKWVG